MRPLPGLPIVINVVTLAALALCLSGCGQRGPLYLPHVPAAPYEPAGAVTPVAPTPAVPPPLPTLQPQVTPSTVDIAPGVGQPEVPTGPQPMPAPASESLR